MMSTDLSDWRKTYAKGKLDETTVGEDPMVFFETWFNEAKDSGLIGEPNAMTISTVDAHGYASGRVVLLKGFSEDGFLFFTNYQSDKGQEIKANPQVCLSFFWHGLERQIIIKGKASKIEPSLSDKYFSSRPKGSQMGTAVSEQSQPIASRKVLEERLSELQQKFEDRDLPRPDHWGGYQVRPDSIEFWQGRPDRLHDRIRFTKDGHAEWQKSRIQP